jgi:hypothetical protein
MDLLILTRKYCGAFMAHCMTSSTSGEFAIGIDPYSIDWDFLFKRILISNKNINGDFSNFDATEAYIFAELTAATINRWYNDSEENQRIRRILIISCFSCYHTVGGVLYFMRQGNPSGCALTTIFNCIVNSILIRYAYMRLVCFDLTDFHDLVKCTFFGDDNLMNISDHIIDKLNMVTYANVVKELGFVYTPTNKEEISKPYYTNDEISYLKNDVRYVEYIDDTYIGKYIALLEKDVIETIGYWSGSDPTNMKDQLNRYNSSLKFAALYGRQYFSKLHTIYNRCILNHRERGFHVNGELFTYDRCMFMMYPSIFKQFDSLRLQPASVRVLDQIGVSEILN